MQPFQNRLLSWPVYSNSESTFATNPVVCSFAFAKAKMGKVDITTESMVDQIMAKVAA